MERSRQRELLPHYFAILLLVLGMITLLRVAFETRSMLVSLGVVVVVVLAYPSFVRWLGVAPASWER